MKSSDVKSIIKKKYGDIVKKGSCCCSCGAGMSNEMIAKEIGYTDKDLKFVPESNMGLGCGNPVVLAGLKKGETVLDLGSGAGFDCFLAAEKVGSQGKVIGVDMTEEMINKARANAVKHGYNNVEFKLGDIEDLPIKDDTIDVVISNCVINLAPDKFKVFKEAHRVLKKGGRLCVSDIVLLKELSTAQRKDENLLAGCVAGALLKDDYLGLIKKAGFSVTIESEDKKISKTQYQGLALESLKITATKI